MREFLVPAALFLVLPLAAALILFGRFRRRESAARDKARTERRGWEQRLALLGLAIHPAGDRASKASGMVADREVWLDDEGWIAEVTVPLVHARLPADVHICDADFAPYQSREIHEMGCLPQTGAADFDHRFNCHATTAEVVARALPALVRHALLSANEILISWRGAELRARFPREEIERALPSAIRVAEALDRVSMLTRRSDSGRDRPD